MYSINTLRNKYDNENDLFISMTRSIQILNNYSCYSLKSQEKKIFAKFQDKLQNSSYPIQ